MSQTLMVIDGHSWAFRAFYALPVENFSTKTGLATNAVYGFITTLLNQLTLHRPDRVGVAFDKSRHCFRTELYPPYKANRGETPPEFIGQVPLIRQALDAMGIAHLELDQFEGDDILATWTTQGVAAGMTVLVASGDRDTFQLVDPTVTVLYPQFRSTELARITPEEVTRRYGVSPELYPDLAALVGETSDNLPGVPGVGPKTAAKWLQLHGSLAAVLDNAASLPGKAGQALRDHLDQVRLNRRLGQLRRDLDLPLGLDHLTQGQLNREAVNTLFDTLEFGRLRARVLESDYWVPNATGVNLASEQAATGWQEPQLVQVANGNLAAFLASEPAVAWGLAVTGSDLGREAGPGARNDGAAAVTGLSGPAATNGLSDHGEDLSLALARPDGQATVVNLASLDPIGEAALAQWLASGHQAKALHGAKQAWHLLARHGLELAGVVCDTALAAYLCLPDRRGLDLADIVEEFLGHRLDTQAVPAQGEFDLGSAGRPDNLDGNTAALDQARQAAAVQQLVEPLNQELASKHGTELFQTIELPLSPVLARMEVAGIAVNLAELNRLNSSLLARAEQAQSDAFQVLGGQRVNLASPKALQVVLFDQLGMPKTKRIKTGYSTNAGSLAELFAKTGHPFLEHLLAHRDVTKLSQMVTTLINAVAIDSRIHTTFSQTAAATGRLASADPNLQNIPVRTDTGQMIRACFVPGLDYDQLMTADYSQIEMRIMAHLSNDQKLIAAITSGEDLHATMAATVFGVEPEQVSPAQRSKIKAMSYGLAYGLSAYGLSRQLAITPGEAQELMDHYFERFGGVRDLLASVVEQARHDGFTQTIMGRRRYLPDLSSTNRQRREMAERAALNAPIQGSAADIVKVAMLKVDAAIAKQGLASRVLLQVHDELVCEVASGEAQALSALLTEQMGQAVQLKVPLAVSVGQGRSWLAAAH